METQGEMVKRPAPTDSERAAYLERSVECLPEEGAHFLGFHLVSELGRGAFSRVFLARQTELGNRVVALKISVDLFNESQTLAQLQHTNIVPIYSAHSAGPLLALCMPYFGRTTLAEVLKILRAGALPESGQVLISMLRGTLLQGALPQTGSDKAAESAPTGTRLPLKNLEKLSYVNAVLWIGARLAEGLAHAHERGIIHCDLKPANILLADDGQPMLLDFNLSEDIKLRSPESEHNLGGTLPYMAPEHLAAFQGGREEVDARSDIFSLGVILYEMLAGQLPYPMISGPLAEIMPRLAVERASRAPRLCPWNRAVSPAVESIVLRCLASDPSRRYQSAHDLAEDIHRHLENRPLRHAPEPSLKERMGKWLRRHPRLKSPGHLGIGIIIALAVFLVPAAWIAWQEYQTAKEKTIRERSKLAQREQRTAALNAALARLRDFRDSLPAAKRLEEQLVLAQLHNGVVSPGLMDLKESVAACRRSLSFYQVEEQPAWQHMYPFEDLPWPEQDKLRPEIADLLYGLANVYRFRLLPPGKTAQEPSSLACNLNQRALACFPAGKAPRAFLVQKAGLAEQRGNKEAKDILAEAEKTLLKTSWDYYAAAFELAAVRKVQVAVDHLKIAVRKDANYFPAELLLAVCLDNLARYEPRGSRLKEAAAAYTTCIALKPAFVPAYFHRGQIYLSDPEEKSWQAARADADVVLDQRPDWLAAHVLRARALFQEARDRQGGKPAEAFPVAAFEKILKEAVQELTGALKAKAEQTEIYYYRGKLFLALKDESKAAADFSKLMKAKPASAEDWSFRALVRLAELERLSAKAGSEKAKIASAALVDLDQALKIDPRHLPSLINRAHILADLQGQYKEALSTFDQIISSYPDYSLSLGRRGLIHARLGERLKAYDDAIHLLERSSDFANHYQAARIYALTSKFHAWDRKHALWHLSYALRNGYGWERFQTEPDFQSLRGDAEYQSLVKAAPTLGRPVPPRMRPPEKEPKP
jgi:serine/threonine protein kinase